MPERALYVLLCLCNLKSPDFAEGGDVFGLDGQRRYVDIYTNYPDAHEVLKNYESYKNQEYVYPRPSTDNYYRPYYDNFRNRRKGYETQSDSDLIKFDSDSIPLQSDYGDFDYAYDAATEKPANFEVHTKRPKFQTSAHAHYNVQKIPRYSEPNGTHKDVVKSKVNHLLKKYLYRLLTQVRQDDADKEEVLEDDGVAIENIETLDDSNEVAASAESVYDALGDEWHKKLNWTKGKFLDESKLLIFKNSTKYLANKFLSLFTIIQFPNSPCTFSEAGNYFEGTCYYATECQKLNGEAMGTCANGYGVCCVFTGTCGQTSNQNCTYFESPNYPNYYPFNGTVVPPTSPQGPNGTIDPRLRYQLMMFLARQESTTNSLSCIFQITKMSASVRQLRIDFWILRGPTNGSCVQERLIVSGQNTNDIIPPICGYNTGQHIYVDVTTVTGPIQLAILSNAVERKRFRLKVCQYTICTRPLYCLQYFTGTQGTITSFNYDQATSLSRSTPGYFNNLNYAICIRKEAGFCSITYRNVANGSTYPFQINNIDDTGIATVPPGQAGAEIFSCPDDFIVINGIRLCGERLNDGSTVPDFTSNAPVTDTSSGPFIIPVRTDRTVTGRGFRLFYTQNRCT